jgi:hypothetical protein
MAGIFCPIHPQAHLIEDHRAGDAICPECGLVVGERYTPVQKYKSTLVFWEFQVYARSLGNVFNNKKRELLHFAPPPKFGGGGRTALSGAVRPPKVTGINPRNFGS